MTDTNSEPKKKMSLGKGCLIAVGAIVGFSMLGNLIGAGEQKAGSASVPRAVDDAAVVAQAVTAPAAADAAPENQLFGQQANAARSANQYLSMSGFSRDGLISQLSSDAGDGYAVADATAAVDSLDVDWNEQAARSAKAYLNMSGFSCQGLIEQLSSDAGDKYTRSQASYGAKAAGAC